MSLGCPICNTLTDKHKPGCTWVANHPMTGQIITIEYAGFSYSVKDMGGFDVTVKPFPGQHPAASKEKHIRAVLKEYMDARPASLRDYKRPPLNLGKEK